MKSLSFLLSHTPQMGWQKDMFAPARLSVGGNLPPLPPRFRHHWQGHLEPRHVVSTSSGHQVGDSVANVLEIGRTSLVPRRSDLARWQKRTLPSLFVALRAKELERAVLIFKN